MRASPARKRRRPPERTSRTETKIDAPSAKPTSTGVCQPGASARKLNAAPLLKTSTRLKKPVISSRSPGAKRASTSHFVIWSATMMAADTANQRHALDIPPPLARAGKIGLAPRAQPFGVHVRGVVPAPLAFGVTARSDFHGSLATADAGA